ncbi:phage nozzle protein [Rhizobium rhizogenes]|uniref:phage nozzle protein n=1 Tax=Rhizobium rhizogenes TaxID=359 RepID=UPI00403F4B2E
MARISGSIPNFINGVSQQAMALRMASQGDLQINSHSTVVDGLIKRPPLVRGPQIVGDFNSNPIHCHPINRDSQERYETIWSRSGIRVFTLDGQERQVNYPGGIQYLQYAGDLPEPPYRTATIGDYTYMTNTQRSTQLDPNVLEPAQPYEAIVYVMAGNYGKTYNIRINGAIKAQYTTPDGTSGAQSPGVDTAYIARRLATGETLDLGKTVNNTTAWVYKATDSNLGATLAGQGYGVAAGKGVIYITSSSPFTVTVEDGYNGHAMKAIQYETQDFSDLPAYGYPGVAIKVKGSVTTAYDDYYVRFTPSASGDYGITGGRWVECAKPGSRLAFDGETMPHALVRQSDGSFTFGPVTWERRKCGDETTSPSPSFVGSPINDIIWFKNRLGFLSEENTILGRSGGPFDFWKTTATTTMDDDPIDVASSETDVSVLRSGVGFADRLILFSDNSQAMMAGGDTLTYKTVNIRPSTSYSMSSRCRPVVNGDNVYFPVKRGQFSMIREYTIDPASDLGKAEDITGNVPQYLRGEVIKMRGSTHEDVVIVQTDEGGGGLYVYKYFYQERSKVQSSWSRWEFTDVTRIFDFWFVESKLYVLVQTTSGNVWIESVDIQSGNVDPGMAFLVHLDHRIVLPGTGRTYNSVTDRTTVPANITGNAYVLVSGAGGANIGPGLLLHPLNVSTASFDLVGDHRTLPIYVGLNYTSRFRLSTIYMRETSSSGSPLVRTEGRLQLVRLLVRYGKTAYLRAEVTLRGMLMRAYATNGRVMGDPNNRADSITIGDGVLDVPILSQNDKVSVELINDSYLPSSIISAEWTANYVVKSRRVQ